MTKGYPYAVVSTNDEYTLSLVFNKYKNNDEDYEIDFMKSNIKKKLKIPLKVLWFGIF